MRGLNRTVAILLALSCSVAAVGGNTETTSALIDAVNRGDAATVQKLIAQRVDVNAPATDGSTALHWAVYRNNLALVDRLLDAGADPTLATKFGMRPLALAAENGNAALIERLVKAGADSNRASLGGETALMTAARGADASVLKVLLANGADPNAREKTRDQTPLMWAAAEGNTAAIKVLLEAGADVSARSSELKAFHENDFVAGRLNDNLSERLPMFTPLQFAVRGGHIEATRMLLDAGANVNDPAPNGALPLHIAILNAHWELAAFLVDRGADVDAEAPGGRPLHQIASVRAAKVLVRAGGLPPPEPTGKMTAMQLAKKLIELGANVNARITKPLGQTYGTRPGTQVGLTPLLLTVIPADPEYMRVLLDGGADPTLMTNNRTNFLMMAGGVGLNANLGEDEEALAIVKTAVEETGLDINAQNQDGDTALHGAAFRGYNPIVEYLAEQGARLDIKNNIGWTPLMEAQWNARGLFNTRPETAKLLRELYEARNLPIELPTREEAIETLVNSKGGPVISCPDAVTVKSPNGGATVINYPEATATDRRRYGRLETVCTPGTGSVFPIGTTTVTCTSTDQNGRKDACAVLMKVEP